MNNVSQNREQCCLFISAETKTQRYSQPSVKKCLTPVWQGVREASGSVTVQMIEGSAHKLKIG